MAQARYEEYTKMAGDQPFYLQLDLRRTPGTVSRAENWHENPEIQFCTAGEGLLRLDGHPYPIRAGDIAVIPPDVIHHTGTKNEIEYTCLIVDAAFYRRMGLDMTAMQFAPPVRDGEIAALFADLAAAKDTPFCVARQNALVLSILLLLCERYAGKKESAPRRARTVEQVKETIKHLRQEYTGKISLDGLAKSVYTNKYVLSREFKKVTGQTVIEYLNRYRCRQAADLLTDGSTVAEAARASGFENMSFFTRTFKRYMGCLPSAWKEI